MTQAQLHMNQRLDHNPEQEAPPAAGRECCHLLADVAEGRVRPVQAPPSGEAQARAACPGRGKCVVIVRRGRKIPRAIAAEQLARQAEQEAQRYAKLAASLKADLSLTRARQRVAWTYAPEADGEGPG